MASRPLCQVLYVLCIISPITGFCLYHNFLYMICMLLDNKDYFIVIVIVKLLNLGALSRKWLLNAKLITRYIPSGYLQPDNVKNDTYTYKYMKQPSTWKCISEYKTIFSH